MGSDRTVLKGIATSSGISSGRVQLLPTLSHAVIQKQIPADEAGFEIDRLKEALDKSKHQIETMLAHAAIPEEHRGIFEAQILLFEDPMLVDNAIHRIQERLVNAEYAVALVFDGVKEVLGQSDDPLFRERIVDLEDACNRIIANLSGSIDSDMRIPFLKTLRDDSVLAAKELTPSLLLQIRHPIAGIITEKGGMTDHTAILARDRNIPAITRIKNLIMSIEDEDSIMIDAQKGEVIIHPDKNDLQILKNYTKNRKEFNEKKSVNLSNGETILFWMNADTPDDLTQSKAKSLFGVGLFRTEFIYLNEPELLRLTDRQVEIYSQSLMNNGNRPITFRMLDVGDDKSFPSSFFTEIEANGTERGIRFLLNHPQLLRSQLTAILRAVIESGFSSENCRIMLPMVSTIGEVETFRQFFDEIKRELEKKSGVSLQCPLGSMIETPAACLMTEELSQISDFFSFGTNDLARFTLALNRSESSGTGDLFYEPSVIRLLRESIKKASVPFSICGEIASFLPMLPVLYGIGLRNFSTSLRMSGEVANAFETLDPDRAEQLTERVLAARTAVEVRDLVG